MRSTLLVDRTPRPDFSGLLPPGEPTYAIAWRGDAGLNDCGCGCGECPEGCCGSQVPFGQWKVLADGWESSVVGTATPHSGHTMSAPRPSPVHSAPRVNTLLLSLARLGPVVRGVSRVSVTFTLAILLLQIPWALACECSNMATLKNDPVTELESHGMVFVGSVVEEGASGCGRNKASVATFQVTEAFKGVGEHDEVDIETSLDSCGVNFKVGQAWLLFTNANTPIVHYCNPGSTELGANWRYTYCVESTTEDADPVECATGWDSVSLSEEEVLGVLRAARDGTERR